MRLARDDCQLAQTTHIVGKGSCVESGGPLISCRESLVELLPHAQLRSIFRYVPVFIEQDAAVENWASS
jgi:hypothetical protein